MSQFHRSFTSTAPRFTSRRRSVSWLRRRRRLLAGGILAVLVNCLAIDLRVAAALTQIPAWEWSLPAGLSQPPPVPADNPLSVPKVQLGKRLFFDPQLSSDRTVACATCHDPQWNFTKPEPLSRGLRGQRTTRNAPTLFNRGYSNHQFWDGRSSSLEDQALLPLENPVEMGHSVTEIIERLRSDTSYLAEFDTAFPDDRSSSGAIDPESVITRVRLAQALASYQRTLLLGNSRVDRFRNSDVSALTSEERHGLWLFESKAGCWRCHQGENFTDDDFHNTGVQHLDPQRDLGRYLVTNDPRDRFRYKTPTLRGLGRTSPYMHDGSMHTLAEVIEFYDRGGAPTDPDLDQQLKPLGLTTAEKQALAAFLLALSP